MFIFVFNFFVIDLNMSKMSYLHKKCVKNVIFNVSKMSYLNMSKMSYNKNINRRIYNIYK